MDKETNAKPYKQLKRSDILSEIESILTTPIKGQLKNYGFKHKNHYFEITKSHITLFQQQKNIVHTYTLCFKTGEIKKEGNITYTFQKKFYKYFTESIKHISKNRTNFTTRMPRGLK